MVEKKVTYKVVNGRFAMDSRIVEFGKTIDLTAIEVKRLKVQGIIGDTLEEVTEEEEEATVATPTPVATPAAAPAPKVTTAPVAPVATTASVPTNGG